MVHIIDLAWGFMPGIRGTAVVRWLENRVVWSEGCQLNSKSHSPGQDLSALGQGIKPLTGMWVSCSLLPPSVKGENSILNVKLQRTALCIVMTKYLYDNSDTLSTFAACFWMFLVWGNPSTWKKSRHCEYKLHKERTRTRTSSSREQTLDLAGDSVAVTDKIRSPKWLNKAVVTWWHYLNGSIAFCLLITQMSKCTQS